MNAGETTWSTVGRRLSGVAFLLVAAMLIWLTIAIYDKRFTSVTMVTLRTDSAGSEMHPHAEVKVRGVVVGEVRRIWADGSGARLQLALRPAAARALPQNVSAQLLPTTLFGQRFVALVPPELPSSHPLAAGGVIEQDRSQNAIELQQVLRNLLPMLTAVQPQKLSATLTAVAQALEGRGTQLGQTLVQIDSYLKRLNPTLPELNRDLRDLVRVSRVYGQAVPDILQAMTDFTVTSRTLAEQEANLRKMYATVGGASRDLHTFLQGNKGNIIRLSASSKSTLRLLARYAPEFPCTLQLLADFVPAMDKALGKGTRKPGLHVDVQVVPSRGRYVPGRDTPVYRAGGGPRCYSVPFTGMAQSTGMGQTMGPGMEQGVTRGGDAMAGGRAAGWTAAVNAIDPLGAGQGDLGLPNSPEENRLINELLAPALKTRPQSLPDWSSVLVGPVYRGTEVRLR